ncbi:hypothetical protein ACFC3F_00400 [Microbacterium sp. NPDC055910]|uniref:hypothetical protein n=1 Tax=Microbacterium sp. NPDC055910 TaxID=3345659 RepID=UPI0035D8A86C
MKGYNPDVDYDGMLADDLALDARQRGGTSAAIAAHVVNWRTLTDEGAPVEWAALRAWVEWFTVRYHVPHSVIPNCWWQHGALVEELSALHTAHTVSFDSSDTGYGPVGFHEHLTLAHPRLTRAYGGGCNNGHQATRPRSWTNVTDEKEWAAWTTTGHAHRDTDTGASQRKEEG